MLRFSEDRRTLGILLTYAAATVGVWTLNPKGWLAALAVALLGFNGWRDGVGVTLAEAPDGVAWQLLIDTNQPGLADTPAFKPGDVYEVTGRSVLLFLMRHEGE